MKPESQAFLRKAQSFLPKARGMLAQNWPDEAGRAAYLAGFHAAQTLIFEIQDRTPKTQSGVQAQFALVARDIGAFDRELIRFLSRAYGFKAVADYDTGSAMPITQEQASDAIKMAFRFVAEIANLLDGS